MNTRCVSQFYVTGNAARKHILDVAKPVYDAHRCMMRTSVLDPTNNLRDFAVRLKESARCLVRL